MNIASVASKVVPIIMPLTATPAGAAWLANESTAHPELCIMQNARPFWGQVAQSVPPQNLHCDHPGTLNMRSWRVRAGHGSFLETKEQATIKLLALLLYMYCVRGSCKS